MHVPTHRSIAAIGRRAPTAPALSPAWLLLLAGCPQKAPDADAFGTVTTQDGSAGGDGTIGDTTGANDTTVTHTAVANDTVVARDTAANGTAGSSMNPTPAVIPSFGGASAVAAGRGHSCAVKGSKLYCWGANTKLQAVPTSKSLIIETPTEVVGLSAVVDVALGDDHTCARTASGALWCWGGNNMGQIGDGTNKAVKAPWRVQ